MPALEAMVSVMNISLTLTKLPNDVLVKIASCSRASVILYLACICNLIYVIEGLVAERLIPWSDATSYVFSITGCDIKFQSMLHQVKCDISDMRTEIIHLTQFAIYGWILRCSQFPLWTISTSLRIFDVVNTMQLQHPVQFIPSLLQVRTNAASGSRSWSHTWSPFLHFEHFFYKSQCGIQVHITFRLLGKLLFDIAK